MTSSTSVTISGGRRGFEAVAPDPVRGDVEQGRARAVELDGSISENSVPVARGKVAARDHAELAAALDELAQERTNSSPFEGRGRCRRRRRG